MIYTLEKKIQRERLNERLRSSLDSTQFRIRNEHFFSQIYNMFNHIFSFTFSNNEIKFFLNNVFAFNCWFSDFSATFLLSTAGFKIFQQLFCFQPFSYFQKLFCFQPLILRFFSNFFTFNRWFKMFQQLFCFQPLVFKIFSKFFISTASFQIFSNFLTFNR